MFSGKLPKQASSQDNYTIPRWQRFWGEVTRLGYTQEEAHIKFGVKSMHDWLAKNHTLDEALNILRRDGNPQDVQAIAKEKQPQETTVWPEPMEESFEPLFDDESMLIDMPWLNDALKTIKWDGLSKYLKEHYPEAKGKTIGEAVESLTLEHQEEFVKEVEKRLEAKATR